MYTESKQPNQQQETRKYFQERSRRGFTLLETALTLAIMAVLTGGLLVYLNENSELTRARAAAQKIVEVRNASATYIRANLASLNENAPAPPAALVVEVGRPDDSTPAPAGSLQAEGHLSASYIDLNSYGQRHALLIHRTPTGGLDALVTAYGGQDIPDDMLGRIAGIIGASGGFVPQNPQLGQEGRVLGTFGGWRTQVNQWGPEATRPSPGHAAATLAFSADTELRDVLFRNDIGLPAANRMNTDISMSGNRITRVSRISGIPNLLIEGDLWALNDVNLRKGLTVADNLEVNGSMQSSDIDASGDITAGGNLQSGLNLEVGHTTTTNNLNVGSNADIEGHLRAGRISATETDINSKVVDSSGSRILNAEVTLLDMLPRLVAQYVYSVSDRSPLVYKPTCAGGYANARIVVNPANPGMTITEHNESVWRIDWAGEGAQDGSWSAIAQTYCFYE